MAGLKKTPQPVPLKKTLGLKKISLLPKSKAKKVIKEKTKHSLAKIASVISINDKKDSAKTRMEKNKIIFAARQKQYKKNFYSLLKKNKSQKKLGITASYLNLYAEILATANHSMQPDGAMYTNMIEDYEVSDILNHHHEFIKKGINPSTAKVANITKNYNDEKDHYIMHINFEDEKSIRIIFNREKNKNSNAYIKMYRVYGDKEALETELSSRLIDARIRVGVSFLKTMNQLTKFPRIKNELTQWNLDITNIIDYLSKNPKLIHTNTYKDKHLEKLINKVKDQRAAFYGKLNAAYSSSSDMTIPLYNKIKDSAEKYNIQYNNFAVLVGGETRPFVEDINNEI
ncbi:hypothetical protein KKG71_01330 [Patescibacteria group bacterium]|nr:hypothetical protein [Patescibacteria group bacterium]